MDEDFKKKLELRVSRMRRLKPCQGKTDEELYEIAERKIRNEERKKQEREEALRKEESSDGFRSILKSDEDIDLALRLYNDYVKEFVFDTEIEKNNLKEIIWYEVQLIKLRQTADRELARNKVISKALADQIDNMSQRVFSYKEKLGLLIKKDNSDNFVDRFKQIRDKCEAWAKENGLTRTMKCSHCGSWNLLCMRTDSFEAVKHPFFPKDNIYYNEHLFLLYSNGKITKEDVCKVLRCDDKYLDWLIKHHPDIMPQKVEKKEN